MSRENVEIVKRGFEHFQATGEMLAEIVSPDFVWDMSKFTGWPEQQVYEGIEGARTFIRDWSAAWDGWRLEIEAFHDAGEEVVAVVRQHGRSKTSNVDVDMRFAQVFTLRDGRETAMVMYADPDEALKAVGLEP